MAATTPPKERDLWFRADSENVAARAYEAAQFLYEKSRDVHDAYTTFYRLYTGRALLGIGGGTMMRNQGTGQRLRFNVTKSAVDAATALIGSNRPRPTVLTIGGDYAQRKKAQGLTKFVNGTFHHRRQWEIGLQVFPAAAITGAGFQLVDKRRTKIVHEFVPSHEMLYDLPGTSLPDPRWHIRWKNVPCDLLRDEYGEDKQDIIDSAILLDSDTLTDMTDAYERYVTFFDAIYIPEFGKSRRVKFLSSGLLEETHPLFNPVRVMKWNGVPGWFLGQGAVEELQSIQNEMNFLSEKIQTLMTFATSLILKRRGTNVAKFNNGPWNEYEYSGEKPDFVNIQSVSGEYFTQGDRLFQRAYELVGVSQLAAQSVKPKGLDSGEALRVYNDIGSQRFKHTGQRWEEHHMEVARADIETAREIVKNGGSAKVIAGDDDDIEEIDFKDVDIERDKYLMRIRPTSILPDEPAGKVEMLKVLAQVVSQTVGPAAGIHVLELMATVPDLEAALKEYNAPREIAEKQIYAIIDKNLAQSPFPAMDLNLALRIANSARCQAAIDSVPEETIATLDAYISQINSLLQAAQPPAPMPGAAQPPPGMPAQPGALSPMPDLSTTPPTT